MAVQLQRRKDWHRKIDKVSQKDGDISWDNIEIWILAKILDTKTDNLQLYDSTSPISVIVL